MTAALGILRGNFGRVALLDMDTSLVPHAHHHCHIILKVDGPDQDFSVAGHDLLVREDTVVLVNTWELHHYVHRRHDNVRTVFLALYIEPAWLAATDHSFAQCSQPAFFCRSGVRINNKIRSLRRELAALIRMSGDNDPATVQEMIFDLTSEIAYQFTDWRTAVQQASRKPAIDFRIRRAIRYMQRPLNDTLDLEVVADVAGLSRPHFNYLFRHCTGVSPGVYANAIRVEAAVRSLSEQREPIAALAHDLGFSAQSNFTRFFQQHTGVAPRHFRQSLASVPGRQRAAVA